MGEVGGNIFSFYNYNLILRLNSSFNDSSLFDNRIQEETWPNRSNCRIPSPISSQLLKAAPACWEPPVHPGSGRAPRIPHASCCWQGHQAWGHFSQGAFGASLSVGIALPNWSTPKHGLGPQNPGIKRRGPWGIAGSPAAACWGAPGATLIRPPLLPEVDFYKTGRNFSFSSKPGGFAQNQKLFTGDSIIVWESLTQQNKLKINTYR